MAYSGGGGGRVDSPLRNTTAKVSSDNQEGHLHREGYQVWTPLNMDALKEELYIIMNILLFYIINALSKSAWISIEIWEEKQL